jgi:DNA (cytosine-5)-methyltransferase 1
MLKPQFNLPIHHELAIDLFAGGGGASTGIEQAIGRAVDIAINHDPEAVALHQANHPQTRHFVSDVFEVDPLVVTDGQPVGLLWASPDCKHFSKAKGGKPVSKKIRSLAWVVVKWAELVRPRVICLENVEEFQTWGPLGKDNMPCPKRKGQTFQRWKKRLEAMGYVVEHRELRACDYGAPTIRKRLFLVARCDGLPIVWPEPTHAAPGSLQIKAKKLKPWRTAAECIDWSIPAPSIFERSKPLADATCRRIAKGIQRYVVDSADPFIVGVGGRAGQSPERPLFKPLGTITSKGDAAICVPTLIQTGYGERPGQAPRVPGLEKPIGTLVSSEKHALVSAFLTKFNTGSTGFAADTPMHTITAGGEQVRPGTANTQGIVTANMLKLRGTNVGSAATEPLHTVSAQGTHHAQVQAFLIKYYGTDQDPRLTEPMHTVPTKDRFGLVTIHGEEYAIVDIGLRMLTPRELYRAQGFPESYQIDTGGDGRPLTKTAQVRMCGNSVCPPMSRAIVGANYSETQLQRRAA